MPWLCATHLSHSVPHGWSSRCIAGASCAVVRPGPGLSFFSETHIRSTYGATCLAHTVHLLSTHLSHTVHTQCHLLITPLKHAFQSVYEFFALTRVYKLQMFVTKRCIHLSHAYNTPITHLSLAYNMPITYRPLMGHTRII